MATVAVKGLTSIYECCCCCYGYRVRSERCAEAADRTMTLSCEHLVSVSTWRHCRLLVTSQLATARRSAAAAVRQQHTSRDPPRRQQKCIGQLTIGNPLISTTHYFSVEYCTKTHTDDLYDFSLP